MKKMITYGGSQILMLVLCVNYRFSSYIMIWLILIFMFFKLINFSLYKFLKFKFLVKIQTLIIKFIISNSDIDPVSRGFSTYF